MPDPHPQPHTHRRIANAIHAASKGRPFGRGQGCVTFHIGLWGKLGRVCTPVQTSAAEKHKPTLKLALRAILPLQTIVLHKVVYFDQNNIHTQQPIVHTMCVPDTVCPTVLRSIKLHHPPKISLIQSFLFVAVVAIRQNLLQHICMLHKQIPVRQRETHGTSGAIFLNQGPSEKHRKCKIGGVEQRAPGPEPNGLQKCFLVGRQKASYAPT